MADIGGYVQYDDAVPVDILFPDTREPTGIVWWVTHAECDAAEELAVKHSREIQLEQMSVARGGEVMKSGAARREREKVAACVVKWDWGDWTFEDGKVPDCTPSGVMEVLTKQRWFFADPYRAINDLSNFTKPVAATSAKRSGSKSGTKRQTTTG
jgi:hypothetical protein